MSKKMADIDFLLLNSAYCGLLTPAVEKQAKDKFDELSCQGMTWPCNNCNNPNPYPIVDDLDVNNFYKLMNEVDCQYFSTVENGGGKIIEFVHDENFKILIQIIAKKY